MFNRSNLTHNSDTEASCISGLSDVYGGKYLSWTGSPESELSVNEVISENKQVITILGIILDEK